MLYRKRPVTIEAEIYAEGMEDGFREGRPFLSTLEGDLFISGGDFIVVGIDGERYAVKPRIFAKTYETV